MTPYPMPVMKAQCASCPFLPTGDQEIKMMVEARCLTEASQICHHPRLHGKEETHLCRGARDYQLMFFYRIGFLDEPTDQAWSEKLRTL